MRFFRKGDKSKAVCEDCAELVSTTFDYRTVPFSDGKGEAKDILVAVCDQCDRVVATPPQSTPAIRAARANATKSIEAKVPAPYLEVLDYALQRVSPGATADHRKALIFYYAHRIAKGAKRKKKLALLLEDSRAFSAASEDVPRKRLSFRVIEESYRLLAELQGAAGATRTDVLTGLTMQINKDLVVSDSPGKRSEIAAAVATAHC